jgi:hypothetical protein
VPLHPSNDSEPLRAGGGVKVTDLGSDHRLIHDGVEQIAHGAMVCPDCSMPVRIDGPLAVGTELSCGYCEESAPARDFLVRDVYDTAANEVLLVARLDR